MPATDEAFPSAQSQSPTSQTQPQPILAIIGPGMVGTTLAALAAQSGEYRVILGAREPTIAEKQGVAVMDIETAARQGDIVLLTVKDDVIATVCADLASAQAFKPKAVVAHCSGALSSDVLQPAKTHCDAKVASLHPLQTFPSVAAAINKLQGAYCFQEGDHEALAMLKKLAQHMGMETVTLDKEAKVLYHAAAVMACNYLTALMDAALALGESAGIQRNILWQALNPLINATLNNINNNINDGDIKAALTGPIARGDAETVQRHLQAINALNTENDTDNTALYRALGQHTLQIAADSLSEETCVELEQLLVPNN